MAPNKKKKKVVANPARGFATVSKPSKTKDSEHENHAEADKDTNDNENGSNGSVRVARSQSQSDKVNTNQMSAMTPEELETYLEESELRNIVDKFGTRCKQDAVRQLSRLQTERRQLRSPLQSHRLATSTWFSTETLDKLLSLHKETLDAMTDDQVGSINRSDEDLLLVSLWTLKRILAALKLPDIDSAIEHVLRLSSVTNLETSEYAWGLNEALEWYAVNNTVSTLQRYDDTTSTSVNTDVVTDRNHTVTDTTPKNFALGKEQFDDPPHLSQASSCEDVELSDLPSTGSDEDEPALFIERYCRLKSSLFRTEQRMKQQNIPQMQSRKSVLLQRISKLTRDPLFDEREAQDLWQPRLRDLEIEAAQEARMKQKTDRSRDDLGLDEDASENLLVGMFSENEEESSAQISDELHTIRIFDFGSWTGAHPRKILEEACGNIQPPIHIQFGVVSSSSFSTRKKLELSFASNMPVDADAALAVPESLSAIVSTNMFKLEMKLIAAKTSGQAECYLSTVMLFLLVTTNLSDQKHHHRLPSTWRTIYQDLMDDQRKLDEQNDVNLLKSLRAIMENVSTKSQSQSQPHTEMSEVGLEIEKSSLSHRMHNSNKIDPDQIKMLWTVKSSSKRFQTMLSDREQLPVYHYKHQILEGIEQNQVLIVCADTGAGKSTQIPSFVLEHELSHGHDYHIIVTQPRRISAISLARRVSRELGEVDSDIGTDRSLVGYAIRLESKVSQSTRLTYATTGVLLRMLESTPNLDHVNCLILDEVHERTMDLDLLFIVLRKLQKVRQDLKIVLMSATVDAAKFSAYFGGVPILDIPGRTFPVDVKFLEDAVEETLSLRQGLDPAQFGNKRRNEYAESSDGLDSGDDDTDVQETTDGLQNYSTRTRSFIADMDEHRIDFELVADVAEVIATKPEYEKYSSAILIFMPGISEIRRLQSILTAREVFTRGWIVHLLHSSFSTEDLEKAFVVPPHGQRKIVISTNIAETGITIPDVTAVLDTCKEKIMRFDERRQVSKLREGFISRSSARQRKGRAARVQEGLCFHLVTRKRFNNSMLEQQVPEMLRLSLQDAMLRIKVWNLGSIEETLAAAINPPTMKNVRRAVSKLTDAGALSLSEELTPLGRQLSKLPLEVVLGKLLIYGIIFKCLDSVLTIIAAISSKSPFQTSRDGNAPDHRAAFTRGDSDLISTLNAFEGWSKAGVAGIAQQYCRKHFLVHQNLSAIEDQKMQLMINLVDAGLIELTADEKGSLRTSRGMTKRGSGFQVPARFNAYQHDMMLCATIAVAFYPRVLVREGRGWRNVYSNQQMSLATSSVNRRSEKPPKWLCYYEAIQSKSGALNALETSRIPEAVMVITMGSKTSFRLHSGIIDIDHGKLKFSLGNWKQMVAIKAMRQHIRDVVNHFLERPGTEVPAEKEIWMQSWVEMVTGQPPSNP